MSVVFQLSTGHALRAPASPIIRTLSWGRYSHFDFVLPEGKLLGALMFKGVCVHEPSTNYLRADQFELIGAPESIYDRALSQRGKRYDWTAVFGVGLHRDWGEDDAWHCCELGMWACYAEGYRPLQCEHLNRIKPDDWLLSPFVKPIKRKE